MRSTMSCSGSDWRRRSDGVLLDARVVEVVLLVTCLRQRAGWRPAGSGRAAGRRECRHAARSRRGPQGQLQQLVDLRHVVDGDHVPQVIAKV